MGSTGRYNPLPYHIGGNPSPVEQVWRTLRKSQGLTHQGKEVAGPVGGIEDEWRLSKARVIARCLQLDELAVLQALPGKATAHLAVYEDELGIAAEGTDEERRAAIATAYTAQLEAVIPALRLKLQEVDSGLDIVTRDDAEAIYTQFGRFLANRPAPDYTFTAGPRRSKLLPNYSSHFVLLVRWSGSGVPETTMLTQVERLLNEMLPAWVDFTIDNGVGFYLDGFLGTLLDLTAFS